ncbi:MAG: hypothetical protein ORN53_06615, partial [Crocinitomicaceae bacterium]|nr:hypothetical protein [Crocinitomicaceae bacterium]
MPKAIKSVLSLILQRSVFQWQKKHLSFRMQRRHKELIAEIKGKQKIRVVFLAIHKSVWKVDTLFQKMLSDPLFDPVILICPYTAYGEERMLNDMNDSLVFFNKKNYPVLSSYDKNINRWIKLNELNPDLLFFTNPNDLTRDEYYRGAFMNYLSCYVPYFSDMATDYDLNSAYNQSFHNLVWKHFIDSNFSKSRALSVLANKGKNIEV